MQISNFLKRPTSNPPATHLALDKKKIQRRRLNLKSFATSIAIASTPLSAQQPEVEPTIVVGSEMSLDAVMKADWIQGEGPKSFEPGKIYIFECWATWCGPCIAMIPHVNELHKKYYDKGLRVYGLSVWEDDKAKVEKFVKRKGDGMSYPVAFTGEESAFSDEWMTPAGATAIPHAFIVRDGKLLGSTQASRLTDSLIETLLAGNEGAKKGSAAILSAQNIQEQTDKLIQDIKSARAKKDAEKMTTCINELKAADPEHPEIQTVELLLLIVREEWENAITSLNAMPRNEYKDRFVSMNGMRLAARDNQNFSADFKKAIIQSYSEYVLDGDRAIGPNHFAYLSTLQWRIDDKENATIAANKGIEAAKKFDENDKALIQSFVRFAKSVNKGTMPKLSELSAWKREEIKKAAADE